MNIVIIPGYLNSDESHWQSAWESELHAVRVLQESWAYPEKSAWVAGLDHALNSLEGPTVLVAHSLGCPTVAYWAQEAAKGNLSKVVGALLVAPPDTLKEGFPADIKGYSNIPNKPLPFRSIVVASTDDPYCEFSRAIKFAHDWQADFHSVGSCGHINSGSQLGNWPQGQAWLRQLMS
ncbi:alpha/beta fold hydrolase [Leeia sp. TBRC 13508]|uniref:Alpha/beta fold hydrolase n=1 Tax=Leeia speluncae TaxID=2884804 RepID=A0ABS8D9Z4_9NEIS|nr:alpha/beta hydrolase [Leeia speluncae]MCB6184843.1 alpha/beta fold hydrolase [Leeia speluncae]